MIKLNCFYIFVIKTEYTALFSQYRLGFYYLAWFLLIIGLFGSQWAVNKIWDVSDYVKEDAFTSEMHSILWENDEDYDFTVFEVQNKKPYMDNQDSSVFYVNEYWQLPALLLQHIRL